MYIRDVADFVKKLSIPYHESVREHLGPTWTAGRDFAIENGRNAGG
jgi:hypothetical protein